MVEPHTFLTALYVMVDDFFKAKCTPEKGPNASLTRSEVVTLAVFGQWSRFGSERGFYRYAKHRLLAAFPTLPYRGQFNRLLRHHYEAIIAFFLHLVDVMQAQDCPYEALDSSGVPTRDSKRRGAGWLPGQANIGWSNRLGWYEGFHLLISVNPQGVIKSTRVSRAKPTTSDGISATGHVSPVHPNGTVNIPGPRNFAAGWLGCARLWRRSLKSFIIPSGWAENAPISWTVSKPVWQPR